MSREESGSADPVVFEQDNQTFSFTSLEERFGALDWDQFARIAAIETKTSYKSSRASSGNLSRASSSKTAFGDSRGALIPAQPASAIDLLFEQLMADLDNGRLENVKEGLAQLQKKLRVVSGRESRERGGWKYGSEFVLDTVLFGDALRYLQDREDTMKNALHLNLATITTLALSHLLFCLEFGAQF